MKVNTDSIILGSWTLRQIRHHSHRVGKALDIGSGSGLLSLMLAQGTKGRICIDAVEVEHKAYQQSLTNVADSPWPSAVRCHNASIQDFNPNQQDCYDLIISNPPYFEVPRQPSNAYQFQSSERETARTQRSLALPDLITLIGRYMSNDGRAFLVLPSKQIGRLAAYLHRAKLNLIAQLEVSAFAHRVSHITCIELGYVKTPLKTNKLNIYTANNVYSPEFRALCKEFYLRL